jgi:hypothetical protein
MDFGKATAAAAIKESSKKRRRVGVSMVGGIRHEQTSFAAQEAVQPFCTHNISNSISHPQGCRSGPACQSGIMNDNSPTAEAMRLRALQAMSPARRLGLALGWSRSVRELTRSSLRQQHPELSSESLHRLLAERLLGQELALKAYGPPPNHGVVVNSAK